MPCLSVSQMTRRDYSFIPAAIAMLAGIALLAIFAVWITWPLWAAD